jgi:DNA-binding CsgD family transcriptional regulator
LIQNIAFLLYLIGLLLSLSAILLSALRSARLKTGIEGAHTILLANLFLIIFSMTVNSYFNAALNPGITTFLNFIELLFTATMSSSVLHFALSSRTTRLSEQKKSGRALMLASLVPALIFPAAYFSPLRSAYIWFIIGLLIFSCIFGLILLLRSSSKAPWKKFIRQLTFLMLTIFPLVIISDLFLLPLIPGAGTVHITPIFLMFWSILYLHTMGAQLSSMLNTAPPLYQWERFAISPREKEVAELLFEGQSYREIGETLFISEGTVKTHVLSMYRKTGSKGKLGLMKVLSEV